MKIIQLYGYIVLHVRFLIVAIKNSLSNREKHDMNGKGEVKLRILPSNRGLVARNHTEMREKE